MADRQSCPEVSLLQRLLDGLLTDEEQAHVNAHLADCMACQQHLDELISGKDFWADVARNLKLAQAEIEAGTPTCCATQSGEALDSADDDLALAFLERSDKPDSLGRLGHYEVLEVIGRGGMGIVLRAFDEKLHRVVAIKVMAPRLAATSPPRKRFLREARAAAQVRHENVVDIHAVEEQPIPHLVMEYVPGESLQQRLDRIGPLEVPDVLRIGQQIARGLAAAHAQGLIHRDVKPGNVLLEKGIEERVKITDFGLARAADDASVTQSGVIAGTPQFMAPEQAQGGVIDHRADLFSLGSVLYTMASGRPPFRAPTSLSVLKRVVEDTPRPIQEIIPEVPQWLCDLVSKLHAKRPEDRFQTAKEVADLLGRGQKDFEQQGQFAALQRPSPVKSAETSFPRSQIRNPKSQIHLRRWALGAAAAAVLLLIGLSLTEATGFTHFSATVIRIFTPDGTLVIETDDPAVKVTVEGDGGLVITGAGLEEIRLRPGSYRVHADKGGKPIPLDKELVTVTHGGREIVRVKLESSATPARANAEKSAFVVLGSDGGTEVRKLDTLAEAVTRASDGDTIEIRGNGPFVTIPLVITHSVTIRAGDGFRPVIQRDPNATVVDQPLLATTAPLVLEGLDLRHTNRELGHINIVSALGQPLYAANCRFLMMNMGYCCQGDDSPLLVIRNCEFIAKDTAVGWSKLPQTGRLNLQNSVAVGFQSVIWLTAGVPAPKDMSIEVARNTLISRNDIIIVPLEPAPMFTDTDEVPPARLIRIEATANILGTPGNLLRVYRALEEFRPEKSLQPGEGEALIQGLLGWREDRNHYPMIGAFLVLQDADARNADRQALRLAFGTRAKWDQFWRQADTDAQMGPVKYRGGDPLARFSAAPEGLSPEDFRLREGSPGYRAGPGGKDLGADIDLVGPGEAYERWKKTPEYQEWLKKTGQTKESGVRKKKN